jgi:hypothetical protein
VGQPSTGVTVLVASANMPIRRFPPPWTVETIPDGLKVVDANGQWLAYVYSRDHPHAAHIAGVLIEDEARRIASNGRNSNPTSPFWVRETG